MHNFYEGKRILVTGANGLIGTQISKLLSFYGANVTCTSIEDEFILNDIDIKYIKADLRYFDKCLEITKNKDVVFNLIGIKGSPQMAINKPSSFFTPTIQFNTNIIEAARINNVNDFMYTSSIGVYSPADIFFEDDVWGTFPSRNDWFAGWAKRMGELQIEANNIEHNSTNYYIVRPANVFGPYDNFDPNTAMVIPSLIARIVDGENPLNVWGDGENVRDFIYSKDVANGMLKCVQQNIKGPINLGSGLGVKIKDIVNALKKIHSGLEVTWDESKPSGDNIMLMSNKKTNKIKDFVLTDLEEALAETYNWYTQNRKNKFQRYNSFLEHKK